MMHGFGGMRGHGHGRGRGHGRMMMGTTTVGERGQVVIPAEAREKLEIEPGDKFVVFGDPHGTSVILTKAEVFEKFADMFMDKSERFQEMAQFMRDQADGTQGDGDASGDEKPAPSASADETDVNAPAEASASAASNDSGDETH